MSSSTASPPLPTLDDPDPSSKIVTKDPLPADPTIDYDDPFSYIPNIIAGFARSVATQTTIALTGFSKGLLKMWFRVPIKLFRPATVNPFLIFAAIAEQEGRRVNVGFIRGLLKVEGLALLSKNMLPLLICNSIVGAVLFNAYSLSMHLLTTEVPTHDDEYEVKHHPFTSGAIAGAFQSLLATPIDNITRRVDPAQVAARRGEGVLGVMTQTFKEAMPKEGGRWAKMKFMYHGLPYNLVKDSMGFSLFFGLFETTRTMGKRFVIDLHDTYFWPRRYFYPPEYGLDPVTGDPKSRPTLSVTLGTVAAVIGAGSLAGAGYQVVAYPFDRLPKVKPTADEMEVKVDWGKAWKLVKRKGVAPFYRGIGTQLVRVAPPSAVGLLIFELANSQLWDEDD